MPTRSWTDEDLARAVPDAHSWRGVQRQLGLSSVSTIPALRARAAALELDVAHFRGQRSWSDEALQEAVAAENTWSGVAGHLGLSMTSEVATTMKVRAHQLGLNVNHLKKPHVRPDELHDALGDKSFKRFASESEFLAAAWFSAHDYAVSMAAPGMLYDLIVDNGTGLKRVQVKSSVRSGDRSSSISISRMTASGSSKTTQRAHQAYAPDDFDFFFILLSSGDLYLVPLQSVVGQKSLTLSPKSPYYVERVPVFARQAGK